MVEYTLENLETIKGLKTHQISDYKGLCGDSFDNIPVVKGDRT
ncbi:MAG: hypothetical protein E7J18_08365 [Clostridioides difficile]|nr:hypothetical protein [Clostridioides difficile]